ncbi:hypothetical protein HT576_01845 [Haloterrigena sp. SYSU A121-1]|uniref:Uncharacterized protein n=1 Tax=Haloterrigena gelatinilytica TaxID=2741724 RepID=A0A8J8GI30_9EURY|nr:hypothetical protein [Haloterrigena gelatinilytica]NUB89778.1 hypothetical protein [Haloterrigena gelatinilytica]
MGDDWDGEAKKDGVSVRRTGLPTGANPGLDAERVRFPTQGSAASATNFDRLHRFLGDRTPFRLPV